MKIKDLPERLKDLAIAEMEKQERELNLEYNLMMAFRWQESLFIEIWDSIHHKKPNRDALQQLRTIYPNDMEFGAVVTELFLS